MEDGSTSWEALNDMKKSSPVQVAEFSISQGIKDETASLWWVKETVSKKHWIIKAMKKYYSRKTHISMAFKCPKVSGKLMSLTRKLVQTTGTMP
jgi:hypothetical protein